MVILTRAIFCQKMVCKILFIIKALRIKRKEGDLDEKQQTRRVGLLWMGWKFMLILIWPSLALQTVHPCG
jgi:hypothetical protein